MMVQDILDTRNAVRLSFPVPDGCMECPLSRSDELGYPFECQWDQCPFNNPGEYYFDPESWQIEKLIIPKANSDKVTTEDRYTVSDISKMLGVRSETVRVWIRSNKLSARCRNARNEYLVYYGDLAKFCLDNPKYIWRIPLHVSAKKIFVGEVL